MISRKINDLVFEKIKMEKLINLANQYVEESWMSTKRIKDERWIICGEWEWTNISEIVLISKNYWFIARLVVNDMIDVEKIFKNMNDYEVEIRVRAIKDLKLNNEEKSVLYLKLLMLLSIQDEPIDFLISILK